MYKMLASLLALLASNWLTSYTLVLRLMLLCLDNVISDQMLDKFCRKSGLGVSFSFK
jgi:hypothetical protein